MLIVYIQTQIGISKLRVVFQNQTLVTFVISVQHLYMTKYKYTTIRQVMVILFTCKANTKYGEDYL